jgi:hypothetical protein
MRDSRIITIENTRFIFTTNFSGDPERDNYGNSDRKANIIIPTKEQADDLAAAGFNVKCTKPKEGEEEGFVPTYFVSVKANYDSEWPPRIFLVCGDSEPELLTVDTVKRLDMIYITNVNAVLNPYYSQRNDTWSLYIKTMYVEQDETDDPFAARYRRS